MTYSIFAFEGAASTSHRLRPVYNCGVVQVECIDTTYGWEGTEKLTIKNPFLPSACWDVNDGMRKYKDLIIFLPGGEVWKYCENTALLRDSYYWMREGEEWVKPVPKQVVDLKKRILNNQKISDCVFFIGSDYIHCAVNPLSQCSGCKDYATSN